MAISLPPIEPKNPVLPGDLLAVLAAIGEPAALMHVLSDLLTPQEIEALRERWQIAQLLTAGRSQRDIAAELGVSVTTVSRGSRQLKYGPGGFEYAQSVLRLLSAEP